MMIVYVLTGVFEGLNGPYDYPLGIYKTKEKAEEARKEFESNPSSAARHDGDSAMLYVASGLDEFVLL